MTRKNQGLILVALASLFVLYWASFRELLSFWGREEYSHGPLIPVIALLLGAHRLRELRPVTLSSWWGLAPLGVALLFLLVGTLSTFNIISLYGFILALVGLILIFWGSAALAACWPSLAYLLFAIPLPNIVYAGLSSDLQLVSSTLGVSVLDLLGMPVYQEGNVIDLGGFKLQVVDACSGLRYLFPLMSFGYLAACLLKDRWWKRVLLVLSTIVITVLMNSLRIALIGVTVDLWGIKMASGLIHDFEGWSIFLVCVLVLLAEMLLLIHIGPRGSIRFDYLTWPRGPFFAPDRQVIARSTLAATGLALALAVVFGFGLLGPRSEIIPTHRPLMGFPMIIEDWHGRRSALEGNILEALQISDYVIADYSQDKNAPPVNLYIAYYDAQKVGVVVHSPSSCIPGGGWRILDDKTASIPMAGLPDLEVKRIVIGMGANKQLVYYWFDERGRALTGQIALKWWLLRDSIFEHRTDGSLIRLVTPIAVTETETQADARLGAFLNLAYPQIQTHLPKGL